MTKWKDRLLYPRPTFVFEGETAVSNNPNYKFTFWFGPQMAPSRRAFLAQAAKAKFNPALSDGKVQLVGDRQPHQQVESIEYGRPLNWLTKHNVCY